MVKSHHGGFYCFLSSRSNVQKFAARYFKEAFEEGCRSITTGRKLVGQGVTGLLKNEMEG